MDNALNIDEKPTYPVNAYGQHYTTLDISNKAENILNKYWDGKFPIDVKKIGESLGIAFEEKALEKDVYGIISKKNNKIICEINSNDSITRQRFTIAHEIGHYVLGDLNDNDTMFRDDKTKVLQDDYREINANKFAAELLMPAKAIEYFVYAIKVANFEELIKKFNVSEQAMVYRLDKLKLFKNFKSIW